MEFETIITRANELINELYYELLKNNSIETKYHIVYYIIPFEDFERTEIVKKENGNIFCMCLVHSLDENMYVDVSYTHSINKYSNTIDEIRYLLVRITGLMNTFDNINDNYQNEYQSLVQKYNCILYNDPNFDWEDEKYDDTGMMW